MAGTKIAFLYSEVAGYFMACAKTLSKHAEVLVVRWPVNAEAPFKLDDAGDLKVVTKSDYTKNDLEQLVKGFNPDIVVCSGWMDKDYLSIVKSLDKSTKRVLSLDNHWNGSLKQRIAAVVSPFYLKRYFTHAWVPGAKQEVFAKKLGFGKAILKGFYCADTDLFNGKFEATFSEKKKAFPKRFLYVARYVEHKGIFEMWEAFCQLHKEKSNDWELWCLGTGDQWDKRVEHEKIRHFGFVQPGEMNEYIAKTGVYILPSKFEPWGVSVQEFAVAGFPLILSKAIGSEEQFLEDNGVSFAAGSVAELKAAMQEFINTSEEKLIEMGELSHEIGMRYTTQDWAERILAIKDR